MTRRPHIAILAALLLAPALASPEPSQEPKQRLQPRPAQQEPRIRVEVNLVNVLVGVMDSRGRPVADLPQSAFEVYEEGVAQKIEVFEPETQQPLDLALMIDSSLSTVKELGFEREAAAHFIREVVRPGDRLSVFEFDDTVTQLAGFSSDVPHLQDAVRRISIGSGTSMYDAIVLGSGALEARPLGRRRAIVLVTDAGETSSRAKFEDARRAALAAGTLIYTILIRPSPSENLRNTAGEHALATITDVTGGTIYFVDEMSQLDSMFDQIDRELRTQYRLGYYPQPRPPEHSFRRIEVKLKRGAGAPDAPEAKADEGYVLHYRKGYFAASGPE